MATMYKEVEDRYNLTKTEDGTNGIRVWMRDDTRGTTAPGALPTVGVSLMVDREGFTVANCKCRQLMTTANNGITLVTAQYSTRQGSVEHLGGIVNRDTEARSYEAAVESIPVGDGYAAGFTWLGGSALTQAVGKIVFGGQFTRTVADLSEAEANAFKTKVETYANCINSTAFEGHRIGSVRFDGIRGGTYYDEDGDLRWSFECVFSLRVINDDLTSITQDDWQYLINQTTGAWVKVIKAGGAQNLYKAANLNLLFV